MIPSIFSVILLSVVVTPAKMFDNDVTLVHGSRSRSTRKTRPSYPDFLNKEYTVLTSNKLPKKRLMPTIGNGHLATVVGSDTIYVNGVYNGHGGNSHRARVPSTAAVCVGNLSTETYQSTYTLDTGRGFYEETHIHPSGQLSLHIKTYAHQLLNHVIVTEVALTNRRLVPVIFDINENMGQPSDDINFQEVTSLPHIRSLKKNDSLKIDDRIESEKNKEYEELMQRSKLAYLNSQSLIRESQKTKKKQEMQEKIEDTLNWFSELMATKTIMRFTLIPTFPQNLDDAPEIYKLFTEGKRFIEFQKVSPKDVPQRKRKYRISEFTFRGKSTMEQIATKNVSIQDITSGKISLKGTFLDKDSKEIDIQINLFRDESREIRGTYRRQMAASGKFLTWRIRLASK